MSISLVNDRPEGGFSFENCQRNEMLKKKGITVPKAIKTGTTIAGLVFKDGVVLGADTRATEGNIIAEKNCEKIHYIADNIYCCGAGTAADTEKTTNQISAQIELHRLNMGRVPRVAAVNRLLKQFLFRYQGHIGAALVLGGVDSTGPHLYSIHPHGSTDKLPYVTMGSGSLAAMSVFERRYKFDMERDDAMRLVRDAIVSGIFNDLGSGSNVDLCVITKNETEYLRPFDVANEKGVRQGRYTFRPGTTPTLKSTITKVEYDIVSTRIIRDIPEAGADDNMDTS